MNFLWRALIAVIVVVGIRYALPAILELIGFPNGGAFMTIVTAVLFVGAALYIIKGPPIPSPFN